MLTTLTVLWYDLTMRTAVVRVLIVAGLVTLSGFLGCSASAGAVKPDLSIVQPNAIVLHRCEEPGNSRACWSATTHLVIQNSGPKVCEYHLRTLRDSEGTHTVVRPNDGKIAGYQIAQLRIYVRVYNNWSTSVPIALIVKKPGATSPVVATLAISRIPRTEDYVAPLIIGAVYSLLVMIAIAWPLKHEFWSGLSKAVQAPRSWSFGGGWVTAISALGATAGTVLAATGFLADVLPGIDVQRFFSPSIVFGGAILAAPVVYTVFGAKGPTNGQENAKGTRGGLYLACMLTLFGVSGQLAILAVLVQLAHAALGFKCALYATLALTGLIIAVYSWKTIRELVSLTAENVSTIKAKIRNPRAAFASWRQIAIDTVGRASRTANPDH
jgi:hypothetical protein